MKDGGFSQSRGPAEASFPVLISQDRDILKAVKGRSMIVKVESSEREILTERLDSRFKTPRLHDSTITRLQESFCSLIKVYYYLREVNSLHQMSNLMILSDSFKRLE